MAQLAAQDYFTRLQATGLNPFPHPDLAAAFPGGLSGMGGVGGNSGGGGGGASTSSGSRGGEGKSKSRSKKDKSNQNNNSGGHGSNMSAQSAAASSYKVIDCMLIFLHLPLHNKIYQHLSKIDHWPRRHSADNVQHSN